MMMKRKINNHIFYWNYLWLFLFAIGFGIYFIVTPKFIDDIWYSVNIKSWYDQQNIWYINDGGNIIKYGIPWEGIGETIADHVRTDTNRVANMFGPFMLIFPKWICSTISLISLLFSVWACFKLSQIEIKKSWLVSVSVALWILTFPWYDALGSVIYQYNYILSTSLCLLLILAIRRKPSSWFGMSIFVLLCIITASWHEGFTAPLFVSLLAMIIFYKDSRNRWVIIAAIIMLVGLLWHFSGTSTVNRAKMGYLEMNAGRFLRTLYYLRSIWVAIIVWLIYIFRFGFKKFCSNRLLIFMLFGTVVAVGQAYFMELSRGAWWGNVACMIMILVMLRELTIDRVSYSGWRFYISTLLLGCSFFELVALDIHTILFAEEFPIKIKNYINNPRKTQFSKLIDYPWIGLPFMQVMFRNIYSYSSYIEDFYDLNKTSGTDFKIVPEGLKNVKMKDCELLEGNLGYLKYKRYLISESNSIYKYMTKQKYLLDYGFFKKERYLECIPFVSEADGRRYVYVQPYNGATEYEIGDLKGIYPVK